METLNLESLKKAVAGDYAAIRRVTSLEPQGDKVFPPTYEGGEYADEKRQVRAADGTVQPVDTVLLV
jgi:CRISPR-associated protein Csb1